MSLSDTGSTPFSSRIRLIQELSKSGIVTLVLISVFAGYLIGHSPETDFDWKRLALTLVGILCLASGSSALNQLQEKDQDAQMPRTSTRPIPSGRLSVGAATGFVAGTLSLGLLLLTLLGKELVLLGIMAVILYNGLYTLWWKRRWAYAAIPGAIPGALPILMGFVSARGRLWDPAGWYLFLVLFFWQMPHFWVLALRYRNDYAQGGFPTLPVAHGLGVTVKQITLWCLAYVGLSLIAPLFMPVGWIYFVPSFLMSCVIIFVLVGFVRNPEGKNWLRFFLWVNFSLCVYLLCAVVDLWSSQISELWIR